jgi:sugar-specific transcriptional regulator TrmB
MTDFEAIQKQLEKVGLSRNQAEIYLLLVKSGELRIQEIVKLSGVARSSVYESLKALNELGIVQEVVEANHKKIKPYSIGIIKHDLDDQVSHLKQLQSDLAELEKSIDIASPVHTPGSTTIRYYKGRSGARQIFWNSLRAKGTVYVYSDYGRARYLGTKFYERFVAESHKRDIKERVFMNITPPTWRSMKRFIYPGSVIARTRVEDIRGLDMKDLHIKGDTLIYDNIYAQVYLKNVEINGFEIESRQFTDSQRSIHQTLWRIAKPLPATLTDADKEDIDLDGIDDPHVGSQPFAQ